MPEYCLSLGLSTIHNADSVDDENADIINFDLPDKILIFKNKNCTTHVSI